MNKYTPIWIAAIAYLHVSFCVAEKRVGDVELTMVGSASYGCSLDDAQISLDLPPLVVGRTASRTLPLSIDCHGAPISVDLSVVWNEAREVSGGVYYFNDNNDHVTSKFCYSGTFQCYLSPTYFSSSSLPVDLYLLYAAAAAGSKVRTGQLTVSIH